MTRSAWNAISHAIHVSPYGPVVLLSKLRACFLFSLPAIKIIKAISYMNHKVTDQHSAKAMNNIFWCWRASERSASWPQLLLQGLSCSWGVLLPATLSVWQGATAVAHRVSPPSGDLQEMRASSKVPAHAGHLIVLVQEGMSSSAPHLGRCGSLQPKWTHHRDGAQLSLSYQCTQGGTGTPGADFLCSWPFFLYISRPRQLPAMLPTLAVPLLLELITVIIPVLFSSSSLLLSLPCPFICKSNHSVDFFKRSGRESKDTNEKKKVWFLQQQYDRNWGAIEEHMGFYLVTLWGLHAAPSSDRYRPLLGYSTRTEWGIKKELHQPLPVPAKLPQDTAWCLRAHL